MKNQAQTRAIDEPLDPQQVIDYLTGHPDFFLQHESLLAQLEIPHESGVAVSLVERQIHLLRQRITQYETRLRDMIEAGHSNQRLQESLHRLCINLFMTDSLDDVIATLNDELRNHLDIDYVSVRLLSHNLNEINSRPERYLNLGDDDLLLLFQKIINEKRIQCGRVSPQQLDQLFAKEANAVQSAIIVPLAGAETFGLIAMGSSDEQRFHPGMAVDYLTRMGEIISAAIRPYLD